MKKRIIIVPVILSVFMLFSCEKEDSATVAVPTVTDTTSSIKGNTFTTVAMTGDQLTLTPSVTDSLKINITSTNSYPCLNNRLITTVSSDTLPVIGFSGVAVPTSTYCTGGQGRAVSTITLPPTTDGMHKFTVRFNNNDYRGSYYKNGNTYTFAWPYDSGVTMSTLVVNR